MKLHIEDRAGGYKACLELFKGRQGCSEYGGGQDLNLELVVAPALAAISERFTRQGTHEANWGR
jgi:hypothetical protein